MYLHTKRHEVSKGKPRKLNGDANCNEIHDILPECGGSLTEEKLSSRQLKE